MVADLFLNMLEERRRLGLPVRNGRLCTCGNAVKGLQCPITCDCVDARNVTVIEETKKAEKVSLEE